MACLDPPLEFLPQGDWYCKSCLEKDKDLYFDRESQPIIYPVDFRYPNNKRRRRRRGRRRVSEGQRQRREGRRRGRRRGSRQENPLEGLSERLETFRQQQSMTRAERAANRRNLIESNNARQRRVKYRANDEEVEAEIDYEIEGAIRRMVNQEEDGGGVERERSRNLEKEMRRESQV